MDCRYPEMELYAKATFYQQPPFEPMFEFRRATCLKRTRYTGSDATAFDYAPRPADIPTPTDRCKV